MCGGTAALARQEIDGEGVANRSAARHRKVLGRAQPPGTLSAWNSVTKIGWHCSGHKAGWSCTCPWRPTRSWRKFSRPSKRIPLFCSFVARSTMPQGSRPLLLSWRLARVLPNDSLGSATNPRTALEQHHLWCKSFKSPVETSQPMIAAGSPDGAACPDLGALHPVITTSGSRAKNSACGSRRTLLRYRHS